MDKAFSPTPWSVNEGHGFTLAVDAIGRTVEAVDFVDSRSGIQDLEAIVHAVNHHDALMVALETFPTWHGIGHDEWALRVKVWSNHERREALDAVKGGGE